MNQQHLEVEARINQGSYYTPNIYIKYVWDWIEKNIKEKNIFTVLDSSCGYGNFFKLNTKLKQIGIDIDELAIKTAEKLNSQVKFLHKNSLKNVSRSEFGIGQEDKLIIVGNPPYNDITSMNKSSIKNKLSLDMDNDLKTRDLGMSFLLSYNKLSADYIIVLHPLSYLIKKANFNLLKKFTNDYKLIDAIVLSSGTFLENSKTTSFPIILAIYKKDKNGMTYDYILDYNFKVNKEICFKLADFNFIGKIINKYPIKNYILQNDDIFFYTMRDINALKRNKTFIEKYINNAIPINKEHLDYYIYVDIFKQWLHCIPYYFCNFDVFINQDLFAKYKTDFIKHAVSTNNTLKKYYPNSNGTANKENITNYFKELLGNHYVINSN